MRPETLWGVYHANGGLLGELAYVVGKLRGTAHCGLCDITHGSVRVKPEWKTLEATLDIPFKLVHLNEQPSGLAELTRGCTPCVVGESEEGWSVLLGPEDLMPASPSAETAAIIERRFRRTLDIGDAKYEIEYQVAERKAIFHQVRGSRKQPPSIKHLPQLPGFRLFWEYKNRVQAIVTQR